MHTNSTKTKLAVVRITDGLGNQLFQFSKGCYLKTLGYRIVWDTCSFRNSKFREFLLQPLTGNTRNIPNLFWGLLSPLPIRRDKGNFEFLPEPTFPMLFVRGYWQHPEYAAFGRPYILGHLGTIAKTNRLSISVRRGDYVMWAKLGGKHSPLDLGYYKRALDIADTKIPVSVFSDDIEWTKSNLGPLLTGRDVQYFGRELSEWNTIRAMASCSQHVIGNSTFHWWGAFLSSSDLVVAPSIWQPQMPASLNILPKNWMKVEANFESFSNK